MIDGAELSRLISMGEALDRELKSDRRQLSDHDIYEVIVALANTAGGWLFIGVEDDGRVTGAKPRHGASTDPDRLRAAVFNNTVPPARVTISIVRCPEGDVIAIHADPSDEPCATSGGVALRRAIGPDGKPQCIPYYPRDQRSRRTDLGLLDFSAQTLPAATWDDLDRLEFERLRQTTARLRGDAALTDLNDQELAKALRLVETRDGILMPNVAGLLLLGRSEAILRFLPTHEVRFQVLDEQENVKVNDVFRGPLLRTLEELETRFSTRNEEQEVSIGLFRLPVPDYAPEGFREAVNNAVLHRDYSRLGGVFIQWYPDHITIASPGSFPEGVNLNNILVHEPKPRNPRLAETFRRIGLVEQTGRGVNRIYMGQLRYGRPVPDYSLSSEDGVRVILRGGKPSLQFAALVYDIGRSGPAIGLDDLLILNHVFLERRADSETVARLMQKSAAQARIALERLVEQGLLAPKGEKRGRVYHFTPRLYKRFGDAAGYVRTRGFDSIQQEQMIVQYVQAHGRITRAQASDLCQISLDQASRLLKKLCGKGLLQLKGTAKGAHYTRIMDFEIHARL